MVTKENGNNKTAVTTVNVLELLGETLLSIFSKKQLFKTLWTNLI